MLALLNWHVSSAVFYNEDIRKLDIVGDGIDKELSEYDLLEASKYPNATTLHLEQFSNLTTQMINLFCLHVINFSIENIRNIDSLSSVLSLKSINIGYGTEHLVDEFLSMSKIIEATLPDTLHELPKRCFFRCNYLESIKLPSGLSKLNDYCFDSCPQLESLEIPKSVKFIGKSALAHCSKLKSITLPDGLEHLGSYSLSFNTNIKSIVIPELITTIDSNIFQECINLSTVTFKGKISLICSYSFSNCALTSIDFPETIEFIGLSAFSGCQKLSKITFPNKNITIKDAAFASCGLRIVILPPIEILSPSVFQFNKNLKEVLLPNTLLEIGLSAFQGCEILTSINISKNLKIIHKNAFDETGLIGHLSLPSSLQSIGSHSFAARGLSSVSFAGVMCEGPFDAFPDSIKEVEVTEEFDGAEIFGRPAVVPGNETSEAETEAETEEETGAEPWYASTKAIAGIAAGGCVVVIALAALCAYLRRRRLNLEEQNIASVSPLLTASQSNL